MTKMERWAIIAAFLILSAAVVRAQQTGPAQVNGCVYYATPPTLTNGQSYVFTCDVNGKLRVTTSF